MNIKALWDSIRAGVAEAWRKASKTLGLAGANRTGQAVAGAQTITGTLKPEAPGQEGKPFISVPLFKQPLAEQGVTFTVRLAGYHFFYGCKISVGAPRGRDGLQSLFCASAGLFAPMGRSYGKPIDGTPSATAATGRAISS